MIGNRGGPSEASVESNAASMAGVLRILARVASHDVPVLFYGERGAGKSVLARALHAASARRMNAFVAIDCQALVAGDRPSALVLSSRVGEARSGTLLLEEVSALPDRLQLAVASLLEKGQRGKVEVRIVATTHRDLGDVTSTGRFYRGLLDRLSVCEIRVPPLRDRPEDILPLARRFLHLFKEGPGKAPALAPRAELALLHYPWPGNVRELRNAMQHALVLSKSALLDIEALPPKLWARDGAS